jgi:hypothetical protein
MDPWTDDSMSKLIELYKPNFITVFCVSAVSGDQVSELFTEAARIAEFPSSTLSATALTLREVREAIQCC